MPNHDMDNLNGKTAKQRLIETIREMIDNGDTMLSIAERYDDNPGTVWRVYHGGDSPQLRRKLGIRKTNRTRLCIDCDEATVARFDAGRGEMSRREYLEWLMEGEQ